MSGVSRGGRVVCAFVFAFLGIALCSRAQAQSNPFGATVMRNNDMMQRSLDQYRRHQQGPQDFVRQNPPAPAVVPEPVEPPAVDSDEDSGEPQYEEGEAAYEDDDGDGEEELAEADDDESEE